MRRNVAVLTRYSSTLRSASQCLPLGLAGWGCTSPESALWSRTRPCPGRSAGARWKARGPTCHVAVGVRPGTELRGGILEQQKSSPCRTGGPSMHVPAGLARRHHTSHAHARPIISPKTRQQQSTPCISRRARRFYRLSHPLTLSYRFTCICLSRKSTAAHHRPPRSPRPPHHPVAPQPNPPLLLAPRPHPHAQLTSAPLRRTSPRLTSPCPAGDSAGLAAAPQRRRRRRRRSCSCGGSWRC